MSTNLDQARSAIASEIGPDVAEFTPTGEKHLALEAFLFSMAGSFLMTFFKGVVKKAAEVAQEKAGDAIGTAIGDIVGDWVNRLRHKDLPVSDEDLKAEQAKAAAAMKDQKLSQAEIDAIGAAVAKAMTEALSKRSDPEITARVVNRVKQEGLQAIS